MQLVFAVLTLKTHAGYATFKWLGDVVTAFLSNADQGRNFVFDASLAYFFAFQVQFGLHDHNFCLGGSCNHILLRVHLFVFPCRTFERASAKAIGLCSNHPRYYWAGDPQCHFKHFHVYCKE